MKYKIFFAKLIIVSLSICPLSAISMETNEQEEDILQPQSKEEQSQATIREAIISKIWEPDPEHNDRLRINIPLNIFLNNTLKHAAHLNKEQYDFLDKYKEIPLPWDLDAPAKKTFDSLPYKAFVENEDLETKIWRVKRRSSLPMKFIK